jgi:uncharacterized protein (TIGR03790 family)
VAALAATVLLVGGNNYAEAQGAANLLLVSNSGSAASEAVARHYASRRGVPQDNVCSIHVPVAESIDRAAYATEIEAPIWKCIATRRAHDRILYIVLTKDIPIRISGTGGRNGTVSSVDSELTLLYRRHTGRVAPVTGFVPNPYFAGNAAPNTIKPFAHDSQDIYLVTRLDGYTVDDVNALIDRGASPVREGKFVLDQRGNLIDSGGDAWLKAASDRLAAMNLGDRVLLDETNTVVTGQSKVLGYYSWGSNDPAINVRHYKMDFVPGALAGMFVSTDGRTFKEPPPAWAPANVASRQSIYAGSHQSLMGDLIRDGVTGVAGHVDEPFLDATIRPEILFPAYASGRNLAEAFYAAMPYLSWQTIIVGDPLCAPFQSAPRPPTELDPALDPATELPGLFAKRRLAAISSTVKPDAAIAYARYESRLERKDMKGARQSLESAVIADGRFTAARMQLAEAQEEEGQLDKAIANLEAILNYEPNNALVLNNVAYSLATKKNNPKEALQYAERAVRLLKSAAALDTLAWIHHLLGNSQLAEVTMRPVRMTGGLDAEMLYHSAAIAASVNNRPRAIADLNAAIKLNPELANRDDVKKLRAQLEAK